MSALMIHMSYMPIYIALGKYEMSVHARTHRQWKVVQYLLGQNPQKIGDDEYLWSSTGSSSSQALSWFPF